MPQVSERHPEPVKMPTDTLPLATAAFRHWETPARLQVLEDNLSGENTDPAAAFHWAGTVVRANNATFETTWRPVQTISGATDVVAQTKLWCGIQHTAALDRVAVHAISWKAHRHWQEIADHLIKDLAGGQVVAFCRDNSPTNPTVTEVPAAAWRHLQVEDWDAGTVADEGGRRSFDVHIRLAARPPGRPGLLVEQAIRAIYGSGPYPNHKTMRKAVAARLGMADVTERTLGRALAAIRNRP